MHLTLCAMAMQDVINKVKGTALGVAEYLTPVLKVCKVKTKEIAREILSFPVVPGFSYFYVKFK